MGVQGTELRMGAQESETGMTVIVDRDHPVRRPAPTALMLALVLALAVGALMPGSAWAQSAPAAPPAPTREELELDKGLNAPPKPSRLTVDGGFERGACALADPAMAGARVTFSSVTFTNLPGVPASELDSAWREFAGREVPVATLCEVRDRAATMLRRAGYLAAVQVPPQRIEKDGEVRLDVLAAKLVDVQVRGRPGNAERQIAAHLRQLTKRPYFNVHEAERQLLLLRGLPGFDVRMTLRPANAGPGEVIGDVVVRRRAAELVVGGQNLGARTTGREGAVAQLTLNDLTGLGDRTVLSVYNTLQTREQTVVQLSHDFAVGADGLRLGGKLVYGHARPDIANGRFSSESWIGQLDVSYPFVRRQQWSLLGNAGFELIDQRIAFGGTRINQDRLRVAFARVDFDAIDSGSLAGRGGFSIAEPRLHLGGSLELRQGVAVLGASRPCNPLSRCLAPNVAISNFAADPQGTVLRAEATAEFRPVPGITLALRPRAQYSAQQLLSFEQFTLGNYTVGRGYDPGALQGDSGVGTSAELRVGRLMPHGPDAIAIQPYVFVDAGWAWNNDGGRTRDPRRLVSAGGGVRARWGDHGDVNLLLAVPLQRLPGQTALDDVRVLFTFSSRLVPWKPQ